MIWVSLSSCAYSININGPDLPYSLPAAPATLRRSLHITITAANNNLAPEHLAVVAAVAAAAASPCSLLNYWQNLVRCHFRSSLAPLCSQPLLSPLLPEASRWKMTRRPAKLPIEDDSTYLTVVHPYPPNTNLQLLTDRRTLALWLACCTGNSDVLRAMFHKPKVGLMISAPSFSRVGLIASFRLQEWPL